MFRIAEPLVTFYEAIMRNSWSRLELGQAEQVWRGAQRRFASQVMGPHFEFLYRQWALSADWHGESAAESGAGISQGGRSGTNIEVDVMVRKRIESGDCCPLARPSGQGLWISGI